MIVRVHNVSGRLVRTLVDAMQSAGQKSVQCEGRSERGERVATGIYFYRMEAPGFVQTKKNGPLAVSAQGRARLSSRLQGADRGNCLSAP